MSCLARSHLASPSCHRHRGFTLVEPMLAVGMLAVLIAVGLPRYSAYRDKVRSHIAAQQITEMGAAIALTWNDRRAYPESLAEVNLANTLDPWGRPYVYYNIESNGPGGARKDHGLNPINTDFDLYSLGRNGRSECRESQNSCSDDIIRAGNGAFAGIAADLL